MRIAMMMVAIGGFCGLMAIGQPAQDLWRPGGGETTWVKVNSQKSLVEIVGNEFGEKGWEYPSGLLAREFPGFTYVSGPYDKELSPKARWRKPVILKNQASGVELSIHCYRYSPPPPPKPPQTQKKTPVSCTPYLAKEEPNYLYKPTEFHQLRARTTSVSDRDLFAFRDGDLLFKLEATGSKAEDRRQATAAAAEAIWKFRQTKEKAPASQPAPPWDEPPPRDLPMPQSLGPMGMAGGMGNGIAPPNPGLGEMNIPQPMEK